MHQRVVADLQQPVVDEPRMADQAVIGGHCLHAVHHEAHEAVALAFQALHDRAAVDADRAVDVHAERRGPGGVVRGLGGGDQQLGRHTAHARTGRAVGAAFDQQRRGPFGLRGAVGREAGTACADDRDIGMNGFHDIPYEVC